MNVCFYFSSDVQYNVRVTIGCVSGLPLVNFIDPSATTTHTEYECFVEAALFQKGMMLGLPVTCSYRQFNCSSCEWNEELTFPVRVCDISRDAQLVFTVYAVSSTENGSMKHIIGGVTVPLFENRILRFGHYKLRIKDGFHGDGCIDSHTLFSKLQRHLTIRDQLQSKLTEKTMKQIQKVAYLDALTNRRLSRIHSDAFSNDCIQISDSAHGIYLGITLANYGYKVVYQEKSNKKKVQIIRRRSELQHIHHHDDSNNERHTNSKSNAVEFKYNERVQIAQLQTESLLLILNDPETKLTNPVLEKNNKLSQHLDLFDDHDARPTVNEQKRLQEIIKLFDMSNVTESDKLLLCKYRKYLVDNRNALVKFLRIINQSNENEVDIAVHLMHKWAPIDIAAALELLSGHFTCFEFRKYGIDVLRKTASDKDLELYIMQLVQAIRFESWLDKSTLSELERFLLDRCLKAESFSLLNFLYWSVVVATNDDDEGESDNAYNERYIFFLEQILIETKDKRGDYFEELLRQKWLIGQLIKLSEIIANVSGKVEDKKNKLRKCISHEKGEFKHLRRFDKGVLMPLRPNIRVIGIEGSECSVFRSAMAPLLISFKFEKDDKFKSFEDETNAINNNNNNNNNMSAAAEEDSGAEEENSRIRTQLIDLQNDEYYKIIWKNGDDLRRDQLIIQMIHLMDNLLNEVNLDLCLTPYPVLATGIDHGMMEFVPNSPTIGDILDDYSNSIKTYLDTMSNGKQSVLAAMQDRFIRSLAGYCVITYLLGVGDRHLDNILVTNGGYLFHIDFGFMFGEEPPMKGTISPKIRIIKQMIDVMGGYQSTKYKKFQKYIISAYSRLRKMAPLILNLLGLIGQGSLQTIEDNVRFVYSRFSLEINEDLAANELLRIVEEAANSIWTALLIDAPHNYRTKHK